MVAVDYAVLCMNRESYDAIASRWDQVRVQLSAAERRIFELLLEGVSPGSRVLDLGCGTGRPVAEYAVSRQLRVTGVDESVRMLELARQRMPEQDWVLSALEVFVPEGTFAAAIAWDSLFHIPRAAHAGIVQRVRRCLAPGTRFALTVGGSSGHDAFTDTMFERTFFYDSHSPEVAVSLLEQAGFEVVHREYLNLPTSGPDKGRVAIIARAT